MQIMLLNNITYIFLVVVLVGHSLLLAKAFSTHTKIKSTPLSAPRCRQHNNNIVLTISRIRTCTTILSSSRDTSTSESIVGDAKQTITQHDENTNNHSISSAIFSHHVAIKTRNISNAIKFYSLLGFSVESKFVAGPARCAWLLHESNNSQQQSRIELLEVPSYMLNEPEGKQKRAIDLTKREELLGLNHLALDVTNCIPRPTNDDNASVDGTACALYQLQEWMDDLNALSIDKFGKSLRVALSPTKRIVGREVYEMAFIYDADGSLVEVLNHSGTLQQQEMADGWEPWDGKGWVQ